MSAYVSSTCVEARVAKRASLLSCDASAVPVVMESARGGKVHFSAMPRDTTVAQLAAGVRALCGMDAKKAVPLSVGGCVVSPAATLGELHDACKQSEDGMLYVAYATEQKMGISICTPIASCAWDNSCGRDVSLDTAEDWTAVPPLRFSAFPWRRHL